MILELEKTISLSASPERVWRAITDAQEISAWFSETIAWEARVGSAGWFGWEEHGQYAVSIEAFEPPRYIAWRWAREADKKLSETDTTLVEWTLTHRDEGGTTLHVKEGGFRTEEYRSGNSGGWDAELGELLTFLGEPNVEIR